VPKSVFARLSKNRQKAPLTKVSAPSEVNGNHCLSGPCAVRYALSLRATRRLQASRRRWRRLSAHVSAGQTDMICRFTSRRTDFLSTAPSADLWKDREEL